MKSLTRITVVMAVVALALMFLPKTGSAQGVLFVANDNVGIGTDTPAQRLDMKAAPASLLKLRMEGAGGEHVEAEFRDGAVRSGRLIAALGNAAGGRYFGFLSYIDQDGNPIPIRFYTPDSGGTPRNTLYLGAGQAVGQPGLVGIGTTSPAYPLHMASGARVTTGGVWTNASSRTLKQDIYDLSAQDAVGVLDELNPVRYRYKNSPDEEYVGFIAEDVPDLVSTGDRKGMSPMDVAAVLTKVVQQQQATIERQEGAIADLASRLAELEVQ